MGATLDTHVLIWYLVDALNKKIPVNTLKKIKDAEETSVIYIPIIVLAEILYLAERKKIILPYGITVEHIQRSNSYKIVPLDMEILRKAEPLKTLEIHDRLIAATAIQTKSVLITKDPKLLKLRTLPETNLEIIWKK